MEAAELAAPRQASRTPDLPVFNLAFNPRELQHRAATPTTPAQHRPLLPLDRRRAPAAGHHQVLRGPAQRRARHALRRRALHPADRGLGPLLLVLPAPALHRGPGADPVADGRGHQPQPPAAAPAGPAQDPAGHHLRGGLGPLHALQGLPAGRDRDGRFPWEGEHAGRRRRRVHPAGQVRRPAHAGGAAVDQPATWRATARPGRRRFHPQELAHAAAGAARASCSRTSASATSSSACPTARRSAGPPTCATLVELLRDGARRVGAPPRQPRPFLQLAAGAHRVRPGAR